MIEKLIQEYPNKFSRHVPQIMNCSQSTIEKGMAEKMFVDYRKKGNYFECTTVGTVKDICDKVSFGCDFVDPIFFFFNLNFFFFFFGLAE